MAVKSQPGQIVHKNLSLKILHKNISAGGVAQGEGPEIKPQYCKKQNKTTKNKKWGWECSLEVEHAYLACTRLWV
jgi:hypothetical protein